MVAKAAVWRRITGGLFAVAALSLATPQAARAAIAGSAPSILSRLAPAWVTGFACGARIAQPLGPPQGALDPNLAAFLDGRMDFALLTREIAERDLTRFRAGHAGREPVIVPVAGGNWNRFGYVDAVVPIVHPGNPLRSLSFRQIDAIFSTTRWHGAREARMWGDLGLRGSWRDRPIRVMGGDAWAGEESARALTLRRHVLSTRGKAGRWRAVSGGGGDHDVVARVAAEPDAIGFTGMGHVSSGVRVLAVAGPGRPPVRLDAGSAQSGRYPLLRGVGLIIDRKASAVTLAFARFLLSRDGQAIAARQGDFMPLPAAPRRAALRKLQALSGPSGAPGASCWTGAPTQAHNGIWPVFS